MTKQQKIESKIIEMKKDIKQLKEIIEKSIDIIAYLEAGLQQIQNMQDDQECETCHDINKPREFEPCASCGDYQNWREK